MNTEQQLNTTPLNQILIIDCTVNVEQRFVSSQSVVFSVSYRIIFFFCPHQYKKTFGCVGCIHSGHTVSHSGFPSFTKKFSYYSNQISDVNALPQLCHCVHVCALALIEGLIFTHIMRLCIFVPYV